MERPTRHLSLSNLRLLLSASLLALGIVVAQPASAQSYAVLHSFTGGADGGNPYAGLTMDGAGDLYGTTRFGGTGYGAAFKLAHSGAGWITTPLRSFLPRDGDYPRAKLVFGPDGALYGTASTGGQGGSCEGDGCGTVFKLTPPATTCRSSYCPWTETVLYRFVGGTDGALPTSEVVFDRAGNLYGTTANGGHMGTGTCEAGCGVVYELSPSHGGWTESTLYSFTGLDDGSGPYSGLVLDAAGNLYGTTTYGGTRGTGTVFELTFSGSGWTKTTLYNFQWNPDGINPVGSLIFDQAGNLYGATSSGGGNPLGLCLSNGCGTVFLLSPTNGGWAYTTLYAFTGSAGDEFPNAGLVMDAAGRLYGTTSGAQPWSPYGNVFRLSPSNGGWTYTSLYDFSGGTDGAFSYSNLVFDAQGTLYGTTSGGGSDNSGVVFAITQ